MNITLGSTSPHKIGAVREACTKLGIEAVVSGIKTASGQNEQPVGFLETFNGALTRALSAKTEKPGDISIGIESGLFRFIADTPITLDMAVIVVLAPDNRRIIVTSEGLQIPEECVMIVEERGFETTTIGSVISERFGGDPTDPHAILTNGKVRRVETLVEALVTALVQL